jgi:dihydrolipoamide dehydrogenase
MGGLPPLACDTRRPGANGFYRLVVDEENEQILDVTMVGYEVAELAHVFIAAMECGASWRTIDQMVGIYPMYGEGLPTLARLLTT